jgi:thiol-disulfide isomerase/thioredoxin
MLLWGSPGRLDAAGQPADDAPGNSDSDSDAPDSEPVDPLQIPTGDADQLMQFMQGLLRLPPQGETNEERMAYRERVFRTMIAAADRLRESNPSDRQLMTAIHYKLMTLQILARTDPAAGDALEKAIAEARADKRPAIARLGHRAHLDRMIQNWQSLGPQEKQTFAADLLGDLGRGEATASDVSMIRMAAARLEEVDPPFAEKLLDRAIAAMARQQKPELQEDLARLEGMLRRLRLPGSTLQLQGVLLDGTPLDWESYRGKVVLVDFWATWCGPCRAEVPNILQMYEAYHERGFDVLGISLDSTPQKAANYLAEMEIPWPTLYPAEGEPREWENPIARYYGISAIPTAILVDQRGKVVHMDARGSRLRQQLAELLGPPADRQERSEGDPSEADPSN